MQARIQSCGGEVLGDRVMGVLATTRSMGNTDLQQFGVTARPEVCDMCDNDM